MPLEEAIYIDGLNAQNPSSTDQIAEGDNHIRLLKATIKSTFPSITGPVTMTQAQINNIPNLAPIDSPDLTGTPTVPTASAGTNTTQAASCAFVLQNGVPSGAIMLWSGTVATIPSGWLLCDGTNDTPDLRNMFVVGAGDTYAANATGGSADAVLVSHDHNVTASSSSTSTVNDPGHRHAIAKGAGYDGGTPARLTMSPFDYGTANSEIGYTNITVNTETTTNVDVIAVGESGVGKNLPPYYALAYIMKV